MDHLPKICSVLFIVYKEIKQIIELALDYAENNSRACYRKVLQMESEIKISGSTHLDSDNNEKLQHQQ